MAKKQDPFFTHLWDELTGAKILQGEGFAKWIDVPAKIQAEFIEAAKRAMNAALGAPARPKRKAAKRPATKKAAKSKAKRKAKAKPKARRAKAR
jgi:hypothetical protein